MCVRERECVCVKERESVCVKERESVCVKEREREKWIINALECLLHICKNKRINKSINENIKQCIINRINKTKALIKQKKSILFFYSLS